MYWWSQRRGFFAPTAKPAFQDGAGRAQSGRFDLGYVSFVCVRTAPMESTHAASGNRMSLSGRISLLVTRARAKSWRQLLRALAMRAWPLSILVKLYYRLRATPPVRAFLNRHLIAAFGRDPPRLDRDQQRCVSELREQGVSLCSLAEITQDQGLITRLGNEARWLLEAPSVQQQIEQRQARLGEKWYVIRPLGYSTQRTLPGPLAELFLHPRILAVVNQYLGMFSRLCYAGLWYNLPVYAHERGIDSEQWHRDYEDRNVLKVYVYLDDVDENMGPLNYLRGTQPGGTYGRVVPAVPAFGTSARPEQLAALVPNQANVSCIGPAGTLLFCDTAGFHRGGRSTTKPRIVVTATYITDGGVDIATFELENRAQLRQLDAAGRFALRER
jgi:hypothetical protein